MRRFDRSTENLRNEAEGELTAKKNQSNDKVTTIVTTDNGTMVEVFKYLNYCQLASNSLVSKRFRDLIQTHRNLLALLYVSSIGIDSITVVPTAIEIFDKELSPNAYNEWVIRNNYSNQAPIEGQVTGMQIAQIVPNSYHLLANAYYKNHSHRAWDDKTMVFFAHVQFNDDNWPTFQHLVRLITDPFVYIDNIHLTYQSDVFNLLTKAINTDHDRLQCEKLNFNLNGNSQKSFTWTKSHLRCNQFYIYDAADLNQDEALLDFIVTGAHCASSIKIRHDLSKAVVDFVQKYMNLKNSDKSQLVESIKGNFWGQAVDLFKGEYAEFFIKEVRHHNSTEQVFEFVNNNIGKKLQLAAEKCQYSFTYFEGVLSKISTEVEILRGGSFTAAYAQPELIIPKIIDDEEQFVFNNTAFINETKTEDICSDTDEILSEDTNPYNDETMDQS